MKKNLIMFQAYHSATKGSLMNSGWRPKQSFIGQINDFWTSVTNVFPQNRTFWRQKGVLLNLLMDNQGSASFSGDWRLETRVQINACMFKMLHMCACNIKTKKKWKLAWTCNGPFWQITGPFP